MSSGYSGWILILYSDAVRITLWLPAPPAVFYHPSVGTRPTGPTSRSTIIPLVELGWSEIPPKRVEEARLVQLEQLRRYQRRGHLPEYAEDLELLKTNPALWSPRCGAYQIIFDNSTGDIRGVGHRREVYRMVGR